MKFKIVLSFVLITLGFLNQKSMAQQKELRHVVMFKFKEGTKSEDLKRVEVAFLALSKKIKQIKSIEWGKNNSPESLDNGFTHVFFVTFRSEADRAIYLPHPDHKAFGIILKPYLDKVIVLDYWANK